MARPKKFDDETRAALIRDAADQIVTGGVESVSLRPLAAKHGVSTTAIYTMFGSRGALIGAVIRESVRNFIESQESVPVTGDPLTDILELGRAYRGWALTYPALYNVMMGRGGKRPNIKFENFTEEPPHGVSSRAAIDTLLRRVDDCMKAGVLGDFPLNEVVYSIWAGVHGWVSMEVTRPALVGQSADEAFECYMLSLVRAWPPVK
ncbi:TetR/AcrR family transcriptional regulator [Kocuria sp. cx-455]|uniref:TetR/AcrR family transcriptional regulator n=1 Tax=Kocuria sp. cx-455 TaxID=2771377 RepID=UPI003D7104D6